MKWLTTWQIGRFSVHGTLLVLVTQSVIWGSMSSTGQASNNSVTNRWWRCPLPSEPSLALPHTNSWLETHFVLLAKIIACTVFQLRLSLALCSLKLCRQYVKKSWWSNEKFRFPTKIIYAVHSKPLLIND